MRSTAEERSQAVRPESKVFVNRRVVEPFVPCLLLLLGCFTLEGYLRVRTEGVGDCFAILFPLIRIILIGITVAVAHFLRHPQQISRPEHVVERLHIVGVRVVRT